MFSCGFSNLTQFKLSIGAPNHQNIVKKVLPDILTPLAPWGLVISGYIKFLIFVFNFFVWQIFFIIHNLKLDVTSNELACILYKK